MDENVLVLALELLHLRMQPLAAPSMHRPPPAEVLPLPGQQQMA